MNGTIFNIQRFCVQDGPGIRTTVFLKGCPLRCIWCHNPESQTVHQEILYQPRQCIGCMACAAVCPNGCHSMTEDGHVFNRENCVRCGACANACPGSALELCGRTVTVEEVIKEVKKDSPFYENSGGGMTLSGGEPLAQPQFTLELIKAAKECGLHVCMETCGFAAEEIMKSIAEHVDLFYFDYKLDTSADHEKFTGVSNERILKNLELLNSLGSTVTLRCPIIPDVNFHETHFSSIAALAARLDCITEIHLLPYHPLGIDKAKRMGITPAFADEDFLDKKELMPWKDYVEKESGKKVVIF